MNKRFSLFGIFALAMLVLPLTGCQRSRYSANRLADFADIWQIGGGVTSENPVTGPVPPSLGLYVQASEFLNLGAVHFTGLSSEIDGRGTFCGPESRTRFGFGPWQRLRIFQDYDKGRENYFKEEDALWTKRMNSKSMRWWHKPAKELEYKFWANHQHVGYPIMHRGWQYWENFNIEGSISEPFFTHMGVNFRLGFDPSEIFDWMLGYAGVDFKGDDMRPEEYDEYRTSNDVNGGPADNRDGEGKRPTRILGVDPNMQIIYFDYDQSVLRGDQVAKADANVAYLKANPNVKIQIEGNCDERGSTEYNLSLGERRALTAFNYYVEKGIAPERLRAVSKGEEAPAVQGHDESAWSKNRRDESLNWE